MFDQLQDPDPPAVTSRHLAVVAERAAGMRRRRTAAASGLAVVALVGAGSLAVAVGGRSDGSDVQVAGDALPQATGQPVTEDVAPTTTVLDPSDLPPAVPVNPDPSDLPPAVPVDPDPGGTVDGDQGGDSTGGAAEQPAADETEAGQPTDDSQVAADETDSGLDLSTSAALRSADPVVAITSSDAAVWFPATDGDPVELARGDGIERVDFLADGTATLETRSGGPTIATRHVDGSEGPSASIGVAHAVGPDGSTICGLDAGGTLIACGRLDGADDVASWTFDGSEMVGRDLTWLDGSTVLVIGEFADAWSIAIVDVPTGVVTSRPFAGRAEFDDLRFAGTDGAGRLAVHDAGTDVLLIGELERFGGRDPDGDGTLGTALEIRSFDQPMRSVWLDGSTEIGVDATGTLTVDGTALPGVYLSART